MIVFVQNQKKNGNGDICILCHNFWTNQNLDLLSKSRWPSEPQFCERWTYICQKNGQKWSYVESDMCSHFFIETVYRLIHSHNINTVSFFFAIRILCLWYDVKNVIWPPNSEGFLLELWWNFYGINLQSMQWWLIADESIWPVSNVHGKTSFIVSRIAKVLCLDIMLVWCLRNNSIF